MKAQKLSPAILALVLSACAQAAKTVAPPPPPVTAQAPPPQPVQTAPAVDAAAIALAERDLRALGYPAGKSGDFNDTTMRHAILAFEKDQGLAEDGQLSPALEERLKQLRSTMFGKIAVSNNRNALFVYSDGTVRSTGLNTLPPVPAGMDSDAPPDLLHPMRPGSEANYHLGHRIQAGGFVVIKTINCHAGHVTRSDTAFGTADVLAVDCQTDGDASHAWHSVFSPTLDTVVQQDVAGKRRTLVAMRPSTANWPPAARIGLDWAITHALEAPASDAPVQWSSTGVARHFEVRAFASISGREFGLADKYAALRCRRFELVENDHPPSRYPGIACRNGNGAWTLAGTGIVLFSPARAMRMSSAPPNLKGAASP